MKIRANFPHVLGLIGALFMVSATTGAQQPAPTTPASKFDVTNYRIEAQLIPDQHLLRAGADVTFTPLEPTRSVVFELNGSLHVESIERDGVPLTNFVQDAVGVGLGVTEYAPRGKSAEEIRGLWRWVWARLNRASQPEAEAPPEAVAPPFGAVAAAR